MINIVIAGGTGRMGSLIAKLIESESDVALAGIADIDTPLEECIDRADVVIDFTEASAAAHHAAIAAAHGKPLVIGTTGLNDEQKKGIREASSRVAIVHAPNMSLGVNVLFHLIGTAAKALGEDFRVSIEETHHTKKLDSPSGTAKRMSEISSAEGHPAEVTAHREGDVVGDHTIRFESAEEVLEINHAAKTRELFARGAITAARWIVNTSPGLYDMADVLGLS